MTQILTFLDKEFKSIAGNAGKCLSGFGRCKCDCQIDSLEVAHLLFSANRWEYATQIRETLASGVTVIMDRYAFSGVAYSVAQGLDMDWCTQADIGLPKPDCVIYLHTRNSRLDFGPDVDLLETVEDVARVSNIANELLETQEIQISTERSFYAMRSHEDCSTNWRSVSTSCEIESAHATLLSHAMEIINQVGDSDVGTLSFP